MVTKWAISKKLSSYNAKNEMICSSLTLDMMNLGNAIFLY